MTFWQIFIKFLTSKLFPWLKGCQCVIQQSNKICLWTSSKIMFKLYPIKNEFLKIKNVFEYDDFFKMYCKRGYSCHVTDIFFYITFFYSWNSRKWKKKTKVYGLNDSFNVKSNSYRCEKYCRNNNNKKIRRQSYSGFE